MLQLEIFITLFLVASRKGPSHILKVILASLGPMIAVLACTIQLSSSISLVPDPMYQLKPQARGPVGGEVTFLDGTGVDAWPDGEIANLSFLQKSNLKKLKKEYKKLKKAYKKRHSKQDFLTLKFETMIRALRSALD